MLLSSPKKILPLLKKNMTIFWSNINLKKKHLKWSICAMILTIPLIGCAKERLANKGCPPLVGYSKEFQLKAAKELENIPKNGNVRIMISDYDALQSACKIRNAP